MSSIVDSSCSLPIKSWLFPDKAEGDKWLLLQNVPDLRLWQSERYQRVELCKLSLSSPLTPFPYYFIYFLSRRGQIFGKSLLRDSPSLLPYYSHSDRLQLGFSQSPWQIRSSMKVTAAVNSCHAIATYSLCQSNWPLDKAYKLPSWYLVQERPLKVQSICNEGSMYLQW